MIKGSTREGAVNGSRYAEIEGMDRFKRCIECDEMGHFKCRAEDDSKLVKLQFTVEDDIDEFIASKGDGFAQPELLRRKRDLKKRQRQKNKVKKVRRLGNSNIMIPTSD